MAEVWEPYHFALRAEVDRIRVQFGYCLLLDLHSIRSRVPRLFDDTLPDLNLGTSSGASASPDLIDCVWKVLQETRFSAVKDARFKEGLITRHYGQPARNVHALQIEIAQCSYMQEDPSWRFDGERAEPLQAVLVDVLTVMEAFHPSAGKAQWLKRRHRPTYCRLTYSARPANILYTSRKRLTLAAGSRSECCEESRTIMGVCFLGRWETRK